MSGNYAANILAEYEIIDSRAMAVLKEIVMGLDNSIEEMTNRAKNAIEDPNNLFLLPIILKKNAPGFDKVFTEIADFASRYLFLTQSENLKEMGFEFKRDLSRYKAQINKIWGVYAKEPHELLISLQYRIKEALGKQKQKEEQEIKPV